MLKRVFLGSRPLLLSSAISVGDLIPLVHSTDSCHICWTMHGALNHCTCGNIVPTYAKLCLHVNSAIKGRVGAMPYTIHWALLKVSIHSNVNTQREHCSCSVCCIRPTTRRQTEANRVWYVHTHSQHQTVETLCFPLCIILRRNTLTSTFWKFGWFPSFFISFYPASQEGEDEVGQLEYVGFSL